MATSLAEAARRVEEDGLRRIVHQHHAQDGRCDHRGGEDTPIAYRRRQGRGSEGAGLQEGGSPGHEANDGAGLLQEDQQVIVSLPSSAQVAGKGLVRHEIQAFTVSN
jgi:hypothetical protein